MKEDGISNYCLIPSSS